MSYTKETYGNNPRDWEGNFFAWMKGVDILLAANLAGLTSEDIPDQDYYMLWDSGMMPSEGYRAVIESLIEWGDLDEEFLS